MAQSRVSEPKGVSEPKQDKKGSLTRGWLAQGVRDSVK